MNYGLAFGLAGICHLTPPQHSAFLSTTPFWPSLSLEGVVEIVTRTTVAVYSPVPWRLFAFLEASQSLPLADVCHVSRYCP